MTQEITKSYFNYNAIPDKPTRAMLRKKADSGRLILKRTAQGIWEMGQLLSEVRDALPYGQFQQWIEAEFGLSYQSSRRFINVFEQFNDLPQKLQNVNFQATPSVLYLLAETNVPDETREVAIEMAQAGELKSVADAKALIEAGKTPQVPADAIDSDAELMGAFDDDEPIDDNEVPTEIPTETEPSITEPERDPDGLYLETTTEIMNADLPEPPPPSRSIADYSQEEQDALSEDEWLSLLPLTEKLEGEQMDARLFRDAALNWRRMRKAHAALRLQVRAHINANAPDAYSAHMRSFVAVRHPKDWAFSREAAGGYILW